jgi:hypothetical protein
MRIFLDDLLLILESLMKPEVLAIKETDLKNTISIASILGGYVNQTGLYDLNNNVWFALTSDWAKIFEELTKPTSQYYKDISLMYPNVLNSLERLNQHV